MINFLKKPIGIISLIVVLGGVIGGYAYFGGDGAPEYDFIVAGKRDIIQEVSVTGRVKPAESVDLAFEKTGIVRFLSVDVGQRVELGQLLAQLDVTDVKKEVRDAETALESAKIGLDKIKLESSNENLNADLTKAYDDGFTAVSDAFLDLSTIITGLDNILSENNLSDFAARAVGSTAEKHRDASEELYYQALRAYKENRTTFRLLDRSSPRENIENIIDKTYETTKIFSDAVKSLKNFVDYMANDSNDESLFSDSKDSLAEYTDTTSEHRDSLLSVKTTINDYKEAFSSTDLDIKDAELLVKQKENNLLNAKNKLSDYSIRAPISGTVAVQNAKVGEVVSANVAVVSLISEAKFEIEANVPEADIAKVSVENASLVTLDAYGKDVVFKAKVVAIDPAETIVDGVATYKVTFQFLQEDERVKSGMTANIDIASDSRENVIAVPQRAVIRKNGDQFVRIADGESFKEVKVETGLRGSDGNIEIISGVNEGDKIITFSEEE